MYSFNYQIPSARTQARANNIIYPNIYPVNQKQTTESPRKISEIRTSYLSPILMNSDLVANERASNEMQSEMSNEIQNDIQNEMHNETQSEFFEEENLESNFEAENRTNLSMSSQEQLNHIEYAKSLEDQFSYYNREEIEPASTNQNKVSFNNLDNQYNQDMNEDKNYDGLNDNHPNLESISDQHLKPGHDQKKKDSVEEFNVMYEDFRKIKRLGYDYNYSD